MNELIKIQWLTIIIVMVSYSLAFGQKHDYIWTMGKRADSTNLKFGGTNLLFSDEGVDTSYVYRDLNFQAANSSICDADGNLMCYTNASQIMNYKNELIEGGEQLCFGDSWLDEWFCEDGFNMTQGSLILPNPENENIYHLFHVNVDESLELVNFQDSLFMTTIDMSLNGGDGKVIELKKMILKDTLSGAVISANRHANGKDWWIVTPRRVGNTYFKFLLTGEEITGPFYQDIGVDRRPDTGGNPGVFSPDGKNYIKHGPFDGTDIYDFNRLTGEFSNHRHIPFWHGADTLIAGGVAISPNSRYLYISSILYLDQFDLWADDIGVSRITIDTFDGFASPQWPFQTTFFLMQLAPNNKIYLGANNSTDYLHVIHNPDQQGKACDFRQHDLELPTYYYLGLPYFPNFRLEADTTLYDSLDVVIPNYEIIPNPTSDYIYISNAPIDIRTMLYDLNGKLIRESQNYMIDVRDLDSGMYILNIYWDEDKYVSRKVIKN